MSKRYYIDTCIWRDYFEDRSDNLRPLGEWAFRLIRKAVEEGIEVIFSDLIKEELLKEYSEEKIKDIISIVPDITWIEATEEHRAEGRAIAQRLGIPDFDVMHAILARDNDAILISRDKHYLELTYIVDVKKPEELL